MDTAGRIRNKLSALDPEAVDLIDESASHHGHAGWREGGETHFSLTIVAAGFVGKTRVQRQRMVLGALKEEFEAGLHALTIQAFAPGER
ncbi:MAG: BolA family transcriptional regulator [Proteobacteria bacterium]|nr:BolA family transcriptional regulator [Pseudomonadota bacterium]MDA1057463.1 BolA family transcriptional regulator [Pseudomonadota bacterium]